MKSCFQVFPSNSIDIIHGYISRKDKHINEYGYNPNQYYQNKTFLHNKYRSKILNDVIKPYLKSHMRKLELKSILNGLCLLEFTSDNDYNKEIESFINQFLDILYSKRNINFE